MVDERKIGPAVADRAQRLVWLGLDHGDLDAVSGRGCHGGQGGREQRLPGAGEGDHGQGWWPVSGQGAQLLRSQLQLGVDRVGGGEQNQAGVGEDGAAGSGTASGPSRACDPASPAATTSGILAGQSPVSRFGTPQADSTIRNDTGQLLLIRDWFGRPLWERSRSSHQRTTKTGQCA